MQRRNFMKIMAFSPVLLSANSKIVKPQGEGIASIIDLDKCDGCANLATPACVSACKDKNSARFPKPCEQIPEYFPRKIKEYYSKNRDDISRLSPYNFTFVESVKVNGKSVFVPRRCMHCDDPTCQKICPFGVISKDDKGAVDIDENFCFGGAKCRDACPWGIPQRQAGVGIYLKIAQNSLAAGLCLSAICVRICSHLGKSPLVKANALKCADF